MPSNPAAHRKRVSGGFEIGPEERLVGGAVVQSRR
jgi:hypothetical protein